MRAVVDSGKYRPSVMPVYKAHQNSPKLSSFFLHQFYHLFPPYLYRVAWLTIGCHAILPCFVVQTHRVRAMRCGPCLGFVQIELDTYEGITAFLCAWAAVHSRSQNCIRMSCRNAQCPIPGPAFQRGGDSFVLLYLTHLLPQWARRSLGWNAGSVCGVCCLVILQQASVRSTVSIITIHFTQLSPRSDSISPIFLIALAVDIHSLSIKPLPWINHSFPATGVARSHLGV